MCEFISCVFDVCDFSLVDCVVLFVGNCVWVFGFGVVM